MFFLNFRENFSRFSSINNPDYDTFLNSLNIYHIALPLLLLPSGCYWQEQLCYMGKDPEHIQTESYYNECKAINDSALRGEMINR
ncbi:MAG: hypothetical protein CM15mP98_02300 [Paracoccaceae bacterium]|nr:MAG: hypothetical protein CM15mP98_02300 [Paracoccaceae bacterium]